MQGDGPHCPFEARVAAVMEVIRRHEDRLGRRVMFAFNLTGDLDDEQRARLLEIADKCPVHRTLESEGRVETRLAD